MVDHAGRRTVGDDRQVLARGDDPVPAQLAFQRQVAGRGKDNGNSIKLLFLQQRLHLARNGFLHHRNGWAFLLGRAPVDRGPSRHGAAKVSSRRSITASPRG